MTTPINFAGSRVLARVEEQVMERMAGIDERLVSLDATDRLVDAASGLLADVRGMQQELRILLRKLNEYLSSDNTRRAFRQAATT